VCNLSLSRDLPFEVYSAALTKRFCSHSTNDYKMQLRSRQQKASESFDSFSDCLRELSRNAYPILATEVQEEMALEQFLSGCTISPSLRQQLFLAQPTSLMKAVETVRQLETARSASERLAQTPSARPKSVVVAQTTSESNPQVNSDIQRVVDILSKLEARIGNLENRGRTATRACWHCKSTQHVSRQCPEVICHLCKGKGHMRKNCPMSGNFQ